jgi:hypothetical protein
MKLSKKKAKNQKTIRIIKRLAEDASPLVIWILDFGFWILDSQVSMLRGFWLIHLSRSFKEMVLSLNVVTHAQAGYRI